MSNRTARTRHSGRQKPHGFDAAELTAAYLADHPGQVARAQLGRVTRRRMNLLKAARRAERDAKRPVFVITAPATVPMEAVTR